MKETELVLTERHPAEQEAPDKEVLQGVIAAWLKKELQK